MPGRLMPGRRTLVTALLGASVALNLLLAGIMLWTPAPPPRPRGFDRMLARIDAALPPADRPAFQAVLQADRDQYGTALTTLRASSNEVDRLMRQEPYDSAALTAAMRDWGEAWARFNASFSATLLRGLEQVSPAGRAAVADARRRGP
jgi:uncharacterized membrane protein